MKNILLGLLISLSLLTQAKADALPQSRVQIEAALARLWPAGSFDQLDELEMKLRTGGQLSDSGWPLVDTLYQALDDQMPERMSDEQLDGLARTLHAWAARSGSSQLARCAIAKEFVVRAWRARGHGYGNTVSEAQWKEFNKWLDDASRYLVENQKVMQESPCWYQEMLLVAQLSSSGEAEYHRVLVLAWQHFPGDPFFFVTPILHYAPKWGGSAEAMISFIAESTNRLDPKLADEMYARQYSYSIENGLFPGVRSARIDCQRWMKGYDSLTTRFPTDYTFDSAALAAAVCQDRDHERRYFARLFSSPHPENWRRVFGNPDAFNIERAMAN